ncbi:MAG: hypothetical protein KBT47_00940 [Armatimonadetes bacterium]|nr:hypothetical protein [Candidatus Hippobium faecium]
MRERTIKIMGLLLIIAMLAGLSGASFAKTTKKKSVSTGIKVPASILNGSDITANRSFRNLSVKETTLAGINLGDSNKRVLQKYGNPSRVIVHSEPAQVNNMGMAGAPGMANPGMPGMANPGMPGMANPGMPGMTNPGMPGMANPGMPAANPTMPAASPAMPNMTANNARGGAPMPGAAGTGMPGMPGMTAPGMPGMPGMPGATAAAASVPDFLGTSERISSTSICWQYDLASGVQLEFIIKDGKVSQITVLSLYPWKLAQLKSGLMIGDTYKLVTYLWGVNYKQQKIGSFSRMTYWDKKGTALIFLNKKLVGMTIAAVEAIL